MGFNERSGERSKPATEPPPLILHHRSSVFVVVWSSSSLERKDRNPPLIGTHHQSKPTTDRTPPPRTTTLALHTVSPPSALVISFSRGIETHHDRSSSLVSILRLLSVLTVSPSSLLVFAGRRTMQDHSDDECLGRHGVSAVGLSALAHDLFNLEITSQVLSLLLFFSSQLNLRDKEVTRRAVTRVLYAIVLYVCDKMGLYVGHEMVLSQARFNP
ncbi:hypothetical protein HID58_009244 [Brassica napus]|uniref:Uncharacterized protein n=1 Tax=Brassica napus TaxID=3708 RepID=A0ABQ8DRY8_BRANA|nr:hypothetical protein HID58_009244 [Brassica napus]